MPQLEFTSYPGQIFWLLVFWSLCYLLVSRVFLPSMQAIFKKRSEVTKEKLEVAASIVVQCNRLRGEIDAALERARAQALAVKSAAKVEAKVIIAEQAAQTESVLEKETGKDMERIRRLEQRIRHDLPDVAERLSGEIISSLLGNAAQIKSKN
ncbi:MAG: hypothetical protein JSS50_00980 [Proteobacteria bacterium]|nr:hypothetical protein [Pseudomonadota bacterium]